MLIEKSFVEGKDYGDSVFNYVDQEHHELLVTITLREYRDLLATAIDSKQKKEKLDWFEQYARANKAEAEVKELKAQIEALKNCITYNPTEGENNG